MNAPLLSEMKLTKGKKEKSDFSLLSIQFSEEIIDLVASY